eukprot:gene1829-971_t
MTSLHIIVEQKQDYSFYIGSETFSGIGFPCPQYVPDFSFVAVSAVLLPESTISDNTPVTSHYSSLCSGSGSYNRKTYDFERRNDIIKVVGGHDMILGRSLASKGCITAEEKDDCTPKFEEFQASFELKGRRFVGCE